MKRKSGRDFFCLVLVQAFHSVEEYIFQLWEVLRPASYVSNLLGLNPAAGFAIANTALVLFGLWCWILPVRRSWPRAGAIMWGWAVVEIANGVGHLALAAGVGGYFPGLYTAPLLIAGGVWLLRSLRTEPTAASTVAPGNRTD